MFNLFRKKITDVDGVQLAEKATIETVYEDGTIRGLFIVVYGDRRLISALKGDYESKVAFMKTIEQRISNNDYKDKRPPELADIPYESRENDIIKGSRIVATKKLRTLFYWRLEK